MTTRAHRQGSASLPLSDADDEQARLLAGLLRASRLTVLYGSAGAGKTALLRRGLLPLLPLLRRPAGRPAAGASGLFAWPQAERQGPAPAEGGAPEIGVFFDAWAAPPWAALQAVLREALAMPHAAAPSSLGMAQTLRHGPSKAPAGCF